jgi:rhodanese-related sulfurtransferase
VHPREAWELFSHDEAQLIDVRSNEEQKFVGSVFGALSVPWATGTGLIRNPRFVREVEQKVKKTDVLLLLCRSGKRSALAARALTEAGFENVFNIAEGFEGELDEKQQRGRLGGWRSHGLPWVQD